MPLVRKCAPKVKYTIILWFGVTALLACALTSAVVVCAQGGSPGTLSFSQAEYDVSEGVGNANITLTRTGGSSGAVTAKVSLTDVTTSPADYRLTPGSVDTSFALVWPIPYFYYDQEIALQPDGKILLCASPLIRLNPDGTQDTSFKPPAFNGSVEAVALQPDGKIIVSGGFTGIPGMIRIARLNPDGSLDSSFNTGSGLSDYAVAIAVQPDGKIVLGGYFTSVNQTAHQHIARLNTDGSVDTTFNGFGTFNVYRLALQQDGKILAGGPYPGLVRFNPDGTIDNSFQTTFGADAIAPQPDGTIIIGGYKRDSSGTITTTGVFRLFPDGSQDMSFHTGLGGDNGVTNVAVQPDGKIIAAGYFTTYDGQTTGCLIRLNADGTLDPSFNFKSNQITDGTTPTIDGMVMQPDGKVVVYGRFTITVPGGYRGNVARFNGDLFVNWKDGDAADKTVSIPIVDDNLAEGDESATLTVTPLGGAATGAIPTSTLKIIDNDVPPSFTSAPPPQAITHVPYTHTFTANGTPSPTFSVTSGALPPGLFLQSNGVLSGTPTTAGTYSNITVTASNGVAPAATQTFDITVASGGTLQFSSSTYSVSENTGTATITVNRVGGSAGSTSVNYFASGGTATPGSDYTLTPGTLNFANGETIKTFAVTIVNDDVNERDETLNLFLNTGTGSATLGSPSNAVLTILNDDPLPTISVDDITVTEGDSGTKQAVFTVTRTGLIDRAVTFNASTADSTAIAQEDYVPLSGQFQIGPAVTSTSIAVSILGNTITQPDRSFFLNLSAPTNATITRAQAACTIKDNESNTGPPTVQFAARNFSAKEGDGVATITVTRSGDTSAPTTVGYSTTNLAGAGAASDRSDYTTAFGTLRFAAGETSKTFSVYITDDALVEGDELFQVSLSGPTGGTALGVPSSSLVRIIDNDTAPSTANPADDTAFYVRQHYRDFLGRDPDPSGLQFWTNNIESCGTDQQCRAVKRVDTSAAFFLSIEFQNTGYLVYRLYKAAFNTGERLPFRTFLADTQEIGQGVVVGSDGWEQKLEANKQVFLDEFVARPQFTAQYPQTLTPAQFVDALNAFTGDPQNPTAGGSLTQAERDQLVADLTSGAKSRAQVLRAVAENQVFQQRQSNKAFVYMQYVGYLRRGPSDAPDANFDGYNFWLSKLNQFSGNYVQAEMVKAFITSAEYRQRFGQP
jgi:uncharacterized delta-60 repeat protein